MKYELHRRKYTLTSEKQSILCQATKTFSFRLRTNAIRILIVTIILSRLLVLLHALYFYRLLLY